MEHNAEDQKKPMSDKGNLDLSEASVKEVDIDMLRSLLRLLVGSSEIGIEELRRRLQIWEEQINVEELSQSEEDIIELDLREGEPVYKKASYVPSKETASGALGFALLGLLFETQEGLRSGFETAERITRAVGSIAQPWLRPLKNSRLLAPLRNRYDSLAVRGEEEVNRWITKGQKEARHSRVLAQTALTETMNSTLDYLSENPEIRELVQSQSTGLADEVLEEARERTVSADTYLEGVVRSLLKRKPRRELPEPSEGVKQQAVTFREQREKWMEER